MYRPPRIETVELQMGAYCDVVGSAGGNGKAGVINGDPNSPDYDYDL